MEGAYHQRPMAPASDMPGFERPVTGAIVPRTPLDVADTARSTAIIRSATPE